ncbi:MAG TPA: hypothetical protein PKI32_00810 [Opitutales bacterium]|nr:hypothetical protein [Opitutales bacterium]
MRISDVSTGYSLISQLQKLKASEVDLQKKLVTGKQVDSVADDPALGASLLNSQVEREKLIQQNDNSALASNIAQGGIDALSHISDNIDLAISVAESAQSDGSTVVASEIDNVINSVLSAANTKYGDDYIFGGTASASSPFALDAASGRYVYNGSGNGRQMEVADGVTVSPFSSDESNKAILSALNTLLDLKSAIASGDSTAIASAADSLDAGQDDITAASAELGTTQARLELIDTRNAARYSNLDDAEESATNSDENEITVKLLAVQNAYSASLQGSAMLLQKSILDYL